MHSPVVQPLFSGRENSESVHDLPGGWANCSPAPGDAADR
jgi:hypothetical protein